MKGFLVSLSALGVMGLAFWAYQENYRTQAAQRDAAALRHEIGDLRHRLAMLNAEWAYLNRPDRLKELAELNFESLGLMPFLPTQFGYVDQVPFPPEDILPITNILDAAHRAPDGEMVP